MKTSSLIINHSKRVEDAMNKPGWSIPTSTIKTFNTGNWKQAADVAHAEIIRVAAMLPHKSLSRGCARGSSGLSMVDALNGDAK